MLEWLKGKKTYLIAAVAFVVAGLGAIGIHTPDFVMEMLGALGLYSLRAGIKSDTGTGDGK